MAFLGVPYRILYEAKNLETGLGAIQVRIVRPNSVVDGPFVMSELAAPFSGRYIFDYANSPTYPQGSYFAFISSPGDAVFTTSRFELYTPWVQVSDLPDLSTLHADLASIAALNSLIPGLISAVVPAYIEGEIMSQEIEAFVDDKIEIVGEVEYEEGF